MNLDRFSQYRDTHLDSRDWDAQREREMECGDMKHDLAAGEPGDPRNMPDYYEKLLLTILGPGGEFATKEIKK